MRPEHAEMFKAVIESGLSALKAAILINGGAAVALLAFLGSIASRQGAPGVELIGPMSLAMMKFFFGVGVAGAALGSRYLSQAFYAEQLRHPAQKWTLWLALVFLGIAIIAGATSFCLFFWGGCLASAVFQSVA